MQEYRHLNGMPCHDSFGKNGDCQNCELYRKCLQEQEPDKDALPPGMHYVGLNYTEVIAALLNSRFKGREIII